jgi:hypothetical protein
LRLDKSASIAGQPVKRIRDLLRRMEAVHWSDRAIADFFHLDETQANALATELVACGLLEESKRRPNDHRRFYELGPQGPRFASTRLLRPITRAKAESIVAAFLQHVEKINERQELLERVCEVRVFGSYLEAREYLGDVDIALRIERKGSSGKEWRRESLRRADQSGHKFRVPDRGSGNPTPLGGWDCSASKVKWLDGSVQAGQPYCLGLQVPPGVGNEVSLSSARGRCRGAVPRITA